MNWIQFAWLKLMFSGFFFFSLSLGLGGPNRAGIFHFRLYLILMMKFQKLNGNQIILGKLQQQQQQPMFPNNDQHRYQLLNRVKWITSAMPLLLSDATFILFFTSDKKLIQFSVIGFVFSLCLQWIFWWLS